MRIIKANERSISFKKSATRTSIKHNNREFEEEDWNTKFHKHIHREKSGDNQYLIQKDIHEMYDELFGEAVEEYNAKQKRNDRKIDNYFSHVNQSKTLELQREFIIQIGDVSNFENEKNTDFGFLNYFSDNHTNKEIANEILKRYVNDFEERNPNLKIYNAVIHNDEASPHLHLNVIPVAEGYKRGVNKQPSFNKALKQQGIEPGEDNNIFKVFRDREIKAIEESMNSFGLERKQVGTNRIHDIREYKEVMNELGNLQIKIKHKQQELDRLETSANILESRVENLAELEKRAQQHDFNHNLSNEQKIELAKPYFPNPLSKEDKLAKAEKILELKKEAMNVSDFNLLSNDFLVKSNQDIQDLIERDLEEKTEPLKNELKETKEKNIQLEREVTALKSENRNLKKTIKTLEKAAEKFVYQAAKPFKKLYFSILGHLSFDKRIDTKALSPMYKDDIEAFHEGYKKAKREDKERCIYRGNDLEL